MKILFIGNSHTYMNDMPKLAGEMIENVTGEFCEVFMLAYSARSLKWHMGEEYFSERFNILHGGYDFCVIQEQAHPMTEEADTIKYAGRIIELCKKVNTLPVIFETWAEKVKPENQAEMNRRYRDLSNDQGALLAPVGEAWSAVIKETEKSVDADLYWKDGEHASSIGDYLVAMVLTKVITGRLPDADFDKAYDFTLPGGDWLPVKEDIADELVRIPPEVVHVIRECVDKAVLDE
ncbi:MAG: hypothetical protein K6E62_02990 [Lachnospiraceae bacterium]|nr:hypothetical protein [Lachnospiraceae bacterium]